MCKDVHGPSALQRIEGLSWDRSFFVLADDCAMRDLIMYALVALGSHTGCDESLLEHKNVCDVSIVKLEAPLEASENKLSDTHFRLRELDLQKTSLTIGIQNQ